MVVSRGLSEVNYQLELGNATEIVNGLRMAYMDQISCQTVFKIAL